MLDCKFLQFLLEGSHLCLHVFQLGLGNGAYLCLIANSSSFSLKEAICAFMCSSLVWETVSPSAL